MEEIIDKYIRKRLRVGGCRAEIPRDIGQTIQDVFGLEYFYIMDWITKNHPEVDVVKYGYDLIDFIDGVWHRRTPPNVYGL